MVEDWILFKPEFKKIKGYKDALLTYAIKLSEDTGFKIEECLTILDNEIEPSYIKTDDGMIVGLRYFIPLVNLHVANRNLYRVKK